MTTLIHKFDKAVEDGAVVPLLYEGRLVEMEQNQAAINLWFDRHTKGLTKEQQADLKKKYARAEMLNKTEQVVYMRAYDISEHFRKAWQGTGFKAQLVAPGKAVALKYRDFLNELETVSCEVIISGPDTREGYEETDDEPTDEVIRFWNKMMSRYLGRQYRLKIVRSDDCEVKLFRGHFQISVNGRPAPQIVKSLLDDWYAQKAHNQFLESLERCWPKFERMGLGKPALVIKRMKTRWGSLSLKGRLSLNIDLIRSPKECIDYVVTHELCHLKHHNHSPAFYELLETAMPDWKKRKHRLELSLI